MNDISRRAAHEAAAKFNRQDLNIKTPIINDVLMRKADQIGGNVLGLDLHRGYGPTQKP